MASIDVLPASDVTGHNRKDIAPQLPSLRSNQGSYVDRSSTGWMRSTLTGIPLQEMRRRFKEDGYIWVKNVMPREDVYDMREQYASTLQTPPLTTVTLIVPQLLFPILPYRHA